MLEVHCENRTILETLTARHLAAGETAPRFHASSRPPYVEAEATERAIALARAADAPLYVVHLSSALALEAVRRGRAAGQAGVRGDVPPLPDARPTTRYDAPPEEAARYVISPPLRARRQPGRALGRPRRRLAVAGRHRPRAGSGRRSRSSPGASRSTGSRTAGRASRRCSRWSTTGAWRPAGSPSSAWSTSCRRRRRGCSACRTKGAIEVGRDADLVLFDPEARRDDPRAGPPPHERLHALRGPRGAAAPSARPSSAARSSSATGRSSARAASAASWSAAWSECASGPDPGDRRPQARRRREHRRRGADRRSWRSARPAPMPGRDRRRRRP